VSRHRQHYAPDPKPIGRRLETLLGIVLAAAIGTGLALAAVSWGMQ
jgi:hypothetical protein